jgi:hypothetical protein
VPGTMPETGYIGLNNSHVLCPDRAFSLVKEISIKWTYNIWHIAIILSAMKAKMSEFRENKQGLGGANYLIR